MPRSFYWALSVLLIVMSVSYPCWALTDEEHRVLMEKAPGFKEAETDLNLAWKAVTQKVDEKTGTKLKEDQRRWVISDRDAKARKLAIVDGVPLMEAYTRVTRERTAELNAYLDQSKPTGKSVAGTYSDGLGRLKVKALPGNRIQFDLTTNWPPQRCSGEIKGAIVPLADNRAVFKDEKCAGLIMTFSANEVKIEETGNCEYHGVNCRFDGVYKRVSGR